LNNLDSIYGTILLFVITGSIIIFELRRKKELIIDALTIFNFYFILLYTLAPLYFLLIDTEHINHWFISGFNLLRISFYVLLSYISFIVGWQMMRSKEPMVKPRRLKNTNAFVNICLLGAIIYGMSFFLFIQSFGGLKDALMLGVQLRYGLANVELGMTAMAMRFLPIGILLLLVCYITIFLEHEQLNRTLWFMIMAFVAISFVLSSLIYAGRGNIIYALLYIYISHAIYCKKINKFGVVLFIVIFPLIIFYGKQSLYSFSVGLESSVTDAISAFHYLHDIRLTHTNTTILTSIFHEAFHGIHSIEVSATEAGKSVPHTFFSDYFWCLLRIIPQKVVMTFTAPPPTISTINTYLLTNNFIASSPPGIIASFIYAAGIPGVMFGMMIYGSIGSIIERTIYEWYCSSKVALAFYVTFSFIYGGYVINGDPNGLIYSIIPFILVYLFLWPFLHRYDEDMTIKNTNTLNT